MTAREIGKDWEGLEEQEQVPSKGSGQTAERVQRDVRRVHPVTKSEERRRGRKISPTLSSELVRKLQAIGKQEGWVNSDGEGMIASPLIEDLLWIGVEAYEAGELVGVDEVALIERRLRRP